MTLEEAINLCKPFGYTDKQIIEFYITENSFESEYVEMISELSKSALNKLNNIIKTHHWLAYPSDNFYEQCYKKKIKPETAKLLDLAMRYYILGLDLESIADELKDKALEIDEPNPYYQPAVAELYRLGVRFKNTDDKRLESVLKTADILNRGNM